MRNMPRLFVASMWLGLSAIALGTFSWGCSGTGSADDGSESVGQVSQAIDPCQQCETRYTSCIRLANQRLTECLNTCSNPTICFQDYSDSALACARQRDICFNAQC